ncbi:hypothetical protein CAPTEDRAFT_222467 [Capitella teleta]|uniref:cystathionine gamma-lyase n=1 Tax=Capitella teleta TaxID=283909 RepID=R7U643_CAPTE|nr:hypothetical protein CAPTEDRAFT_222467 [Capitella teleta]|eukprot:ELU01835.1 hypothetical protein CAPTEDRAFT_222467 [Capitella teleta]
MSKHWTPSISTLDSGVEGIKLDDLSQASHCVATRLHTPDRGREEVPLVTPIFHSSTYKVQSVQHYADVLQEGGYIYSRLGNPTCEAVECAINALERGAGSLVFGCGMAALSTALLASLKAGDHVVACNPLYSGTHSIMKEVFPKFNIEVSWVQSGCGIEEYAKKIKDNTKLLFGETPCNPLISITDLSALASLAKSKGLLTVVDSTYAPPTIQQPISLGIDVVIHSATKYLGGHSDLVAGVITTSTSPFEASLLLRGVKTLSIRVDRHCSNAIKIAQFLEEHPKVAKVFYPGLRTDPGYEIAKRQMKQFGGMVAFEMKEGFQAAKTVIENVRLVQLAVSLGGVESLIEHPASMTHGPMIMTDEHRKEGLITGGLVRLSVGLEDAEDLIKDLQQALEKA